MKKRGSLIIVLVFVATVTILAGCDEQQEALDLDVVNLGELIADVDSWRASEPDKLAFSNDALTITPGLDNRTAAGYFGQAFLDDMFEIYFTPETLDENGVWPGFVLRSSEPTQYSWLGNDGYLFVVKEDIFELQGWKDRRRTFFEVFPNDVVEAGETSILRAQALNTDEGVQLTLMVGYTVVAEYLDTANLLPDAGYLGLVAPGTVVTFAGSK